MDLRKVLATLGIAACVWPFAFFVALLPFYTAGHHLELLDGSAHPALHTFVFLICGATATWASVWVYRRAFRAR